MASIALIRNKKKRRSAQKDPIRPAFHRWLMLFANPCVSAVSYSSCPQMISPRRRREAAEWPRGGIGLYRSSPRSLRTCGESLFLPTSNPLQPIGQRPDSSQPFSEASRIRTRTASGSAPRSPAASAVEWPSNRSSTTAAFALAQPVKEPSQFVTQLGLSKRATACGIRERRHDLHCIFVAVGRLRQLLLCCKAPLSASRFPADDGQSQRHQFVRG